MTRDKVTSPGGKVTSRDCTLSGQSTDSAVTKYSVFRAAAGISRHRDSASSRVRNGPSAGHGRAVLARAGRMLLDKDYGSRRGWRGSDATREDQPSIRDGVTDSEGRLDSESP